MERQCGRCSRTYGYSADGSADCPWCGRVVALEHVYAPGDAALGRGVPTAAAPADAGPTPWERRDELGFRRALGATLKGVLLDPQRFLERVDYQRRDGVHLYAALVIAVQAAGGIAAFWFNNPAAELREAADLLAGTGSYLLAERILLVHDALGWMRAHALVSTVLAGTVIYAFTWLWFLGAVVGTHLVLRAFGLANAPLGATYKAFAYSNTPMMFASVPVVGWIFAGLWALVLNVLAIASAHRISMGAAALGVLLLPILHVGLIFAAVAAVIVAVSIA